MKAKIFEIKRFAVHDGDGIRTTVFFKGCSLKCVWCHNPEGISAKSKLAYYAHKCISCGECLSVCPTSAHTIENGKHAFNREKCIACGRCVEACLGNALTLYGRETTVEELLPILLQDKEFYNHSDGGVTFSGGECMLQIDFLEEILKVCKANGVHTAVDTAGNVSWEHFEKILPYTDLFLYDVKCFSEDLHKDGTGVSNRLILENLQKLSENKAEIVVRIPVIPEFNGNDYEMQKIADYLKNLRIGKVELLPYHAMGEHKWAAIGKKTTRFSVPSNGDIDKFKELFNGF